jgi:nucleotide-binding universal stress UspA family protein
VICYAANLARGFQAQLSLIHAIGFGDALLDDRLGVEPRVSFVESARGIITALQREAGAAAEADVEFGGVADVVREAALRRRADLVVIGRGRMRRTLGRLRTNAQAIVRESPCPVLGM